MLFVSVRSRLILWQMLILSITLFLFGMVLYHNFSHKLKSDMDGLLRSRAEGIAASIDTYWETERLEADKNAQPSLFRKQDNINFLKIARRWVDEKNMDPALINFSVHIFDAYGRPVASSKDIPTPALPEKVFKEMLHGKGQYGSMKVDMPPGKAVSLRTFTVPVIENRELAYVVQVASPLRDMYTALQSLSLLLLLFLPLTVLLTGISGAFLAKVALRPVHQMIGTIHQITAENLRLRVDVPRSRDEISSLAVTFNEMIMRLDDSFTSRRQFMEDISHELKTPLAVLKGELEVTLKKVRSAGEYEDILQSNLEEINRLVRIVENLLVLAKFDAETLDLEPKLFDPNVLAREVLEDMRVLAHQKQISLDLHEGQPVSLFADLGQIRRVLLNLLDNALKYTPENGKVSVSIWQEGGQIKMEVADNGIGIPAEDLPRVFDRFYRVEQSRHRGGFGLGLSIAQSIVQAHKGRIDVKSAPREGTSFLVSLPAVDP